MNEPNEQPGSSPGRSNPIGELTPIEKQLYQAKRLYATLSQVNQAIVRVKQRDNLYQSICDVAVQFGEFALAWIGLLDEGTGDIMPVAANGVDLRNWPFPIFNVRQADMQDLLTVAATRTGQLATSEDVQTDRRTRYMRDPATRYGFRSLAAVPFSCKDGTIGVLNLISVEAGLFDDEEELHLLEEIGSDISYALDNIASEERYRTTLDQMMEGCQIIDYDWRYVYINAAAAAHGRSTPGELLDHTMMEMYPGIENTSLFESMNDCMQNRVPQVLENEFVYPDGDRGWFELRIQPVPEGIFILSVDITGRKQAEQQLQASEATLKLFVENAPAGIAMFDRDMRYLAASQRYSLDYRLGELDLIGRSHYDVFPEIPERWKAIHRRCLEGASESTEEDPFPRADGSLDWVRWEIHPWRQPDGTVGGIILFSEVITERKLAIERIKESEEEYRSLFTNMAEGIAYCQMIYEDGEPVDWIYHSVNPAFETQTGLVGIAGKKVTDAIPGIRATDPELFEIYGRVASTGSPEKFEIFVEALQDWFSVSVYSPRKEYFVAVFDVVTERKRAEEELIFRNVLLTTQQEASIDAILVVDENARILSYNRHFVEMWNIPEALVMAGEDVLVLQSVTDLVQDSQAFLRRIRDLYEDKNVTAQDELSLKDGRVIDRYTAPIFGSDGRYFGRVWYFRDITARKRSEEAVIESERQMAALVTSLDDIVFEVDERGVYLNVWASDESLLVQPKVQLLGRRIVEALGEESGQPFELAVQQVLAGGEPVSIEYPLEVIGGERWFVAKVSPIQSEAGSRRSASMLIRDITEKKRIEREIQHRNEDLSLINALNDAVNQGEDLSGIAAVFAGEVRRLLGFQDVAVYLISPDGQYIEMQSTSLQGPLYERIERLIGRPMPRVRIPLSDGAYIRQALSNSGGTIISDPQVIQEWMQEFAGTIFLPPALRPSLRKLIPPIYNLLKIHAVFTLPLISSGRTIGLLEISSREPIAEQSIQRIRAIGPQLTAVLLRKMAEQQVQLQLDRLRALRHIDQAISTNLDMRVSIDVLLDEVRSQLKVDAALVMLFNESSLMLEFFAGKGLRKLGINPVRLRLGEGLAGQVGLERKLLHIQNLENARNLVHRPEIFQNEQFLEYFGLPLVAKGVLKGVFEVFNRSPLVPDSDWLSFLETLAGQAAIAIDSSQAFDGLQRSNLNLSLAYDATIEGWSRAMDLRDRETEGHTRRVTEMTLRLAERLNFSQQELVHTRRGALLHDIGKLGIPDQILLKPGPLTEEEWALMRQHPQFAYDMIASIDYLRPAMDIPYCHHEMWDGKGYPRGLAGEKIPLAARLFAVVDVWDALSSDRPYRRAWSQEKVLDHIRSLSGTHFDPQAVTLFLQVIAELGGNPPDA